MSGKCISLSDFLLGYRFWGEWTISYHDSTHLATGKKVQIAKFLIDYDETEAKNSLYLPYILRVHSEDEITKSLQAEGVLSTESTEKVLPHASLIRSLIAESAARTGAIRYELELLGRQNLSDALPSLFHLPYIILVTDTGAVRYGVSSFITNSLPRVTVWTIVPVFVMIEVQSRADSLNAVYRETLSKAEPKNVRILRQRPQVTCVAREIQNIKLNQPIEFFQAAPELIARVKGFEPKDLRTGNDSLRDSINDRLIIEATKKLRQERSLGKELFLATSDKNMASLAQLENLEAIYIKKPQMLQEVVSVRYNAFSTDQSFLVSPIHSLLWDLTHIMSSVHVDNQEQGRHYELNYYSDHRIDLTHDVLEMIEH